MMKFRKAPRMIAPQPLAHMLMLCAVLLAATQPAAADPALDEARHLLQTGRVDAATAIYEAYLKAHPTALTAELALAEIAMRRYEYERARQILEKTLAQHPESAETAAMLGRLFQLQINSPGGKAYDNRRDYRALATEHFRQATSINPNSPLVLTYLAEWQIQQGDAVSAEKNLNRALQLAPGFLPAFHGQIRFFMKVNDLSRAKDAALHAMELNPLDSATHFLTAQLLALANRPAEAVRYAERSEQLDYGRLPERDYFLAAQYEKLGELERAFQYYQNLTVYTPRQAQVWLKLAELADSLNRPDTSMAAYQQALALNPALADELFQHARDNTRAGKSETALQQWRKLLALQPDNPLLVREALGAIAGLHYLAHLQNPTQANPSLQRDLHYFPASDQSPEQQLNRLKLQIAAVPGPLSPEIQQQLSLLALQQVNPAVAGEAAFLLNDFTQARTLWEQVDGLSAQEYAMLADRLILIQEVLFAQTFYQRAYELSPTPTLEAAIKRLQARQNLAIQRVNEGNALFKSKDYTGAIAKYEEARQLNRQGDNIYLRLADTYEQLKDWQKAASAYRTAVSLSPSLMDSKGFAKHYRKIQKKAQR